LLMIQKEKLGLFYRLRQTCWKWQSQMSEDVFLGKFRLGYCQAKTG
jgi:hypothetical protein